MIIVKKLCLTLLFSGLYSPSLIAFADTSLKQLSPNNQKKILDPIYQSSDLSTQSPILNHVAKKKPLQTSDQSSKAQNIKSHARPCEDVQPESTLLRSLQLDLKSQSKTELRQQRIEQFWQTVQQQGTPYVEKIDAEKSRIIFLWNGPEHNVRLIGGPSNDHEWLTRLAGTNIWFKEAIVKNQFMGSYSYAVNVPLVDDFLTHYCPHLNPNLKESRPQRRAVLKVNKLDPYNPRRFFNNSPNQSALRNENIVILAQSPAFIDLSQFANHKQPELKTYRFESKILNNSRVIQIYQSKKIKKNQNYITAIFFDGQHYAELLNVPKALDILVEQGKLPPIQAVFLSPPNEQIRPQELTPNPEFSKFFSQEFLPWLDEKLPNKRHKNKTVLLGSSLGGLSSAYLALENPKHISHVVPLSGSFWWQEHPSDLPNGMSKIIREKQKQPKQAWYITANSYESSRNNNELSILETTPIVAQDLREKGHDVEYKNYVGGHSYAIWQGILQDALLHFFQD
ncbi:DUF3327 domain-containing protein [Acinetobacter sp. 194]|uniref:alpha/beta hydrolase-fold protein n=1 Tax=Acinetobacter shaoyimingii TaxID=2715164 RepID=UPI00140B9EC9|nr:alpha/beta hydrolase-fold protein [Acinetobacter shaoyimingii]NHB57474.1 DUF3327 domain-containing protein [Acinetobacter shaoyimingii]